MTIATTIVAMSQRDCLVLPTAEYLWEANSSKSFFLLLIMRAGFDLDAPRACSHRKRTAMRCIGSAGRVLRLLVVAIRDLQAGSGAVNRP
jgi:hypothetical protein